MAWGKNASPSDPLSSSSSGSSCDEILQRLEQNDSTLTSITILPMKSFSDQELDRISQVFESSSITKHPVHLQSLNCSGHAVSSKSLQRFGAAIASLCKNIKISNFTTLAIGDVTMGDVGVQAFVEGLLSQQQHGDDNDTCQMNGSLTTLDLSYKGMTLIGLMALAQLCNVCTGITHLNVSRNTFTYVKGVIELPEGVDVMFCNVIELDMSSCEIDTKLTRRLFHFLDLNDGDDTNGTGGTGASHRSLNSESEARSLQRNVNDIKEKKSKKRSSSPMKRNRKSQQRNTRSIRLDNNPIGDKGLKQLLKLSRLDGIYVSNCDLTDAGMLLLSVASSAALSEVLTLDISNNKAITKTGMTVLGDALKRRFISVLLPKLTHINISGNGSIGVDGVQALMLGLAGRTLESCDFSETNCRGPGAILAIVGSVREYCCTIQSLRLYNNNVGSNGFYKISEILSDILLTSEIHTLDLAGNNAGQGSVVELLKAVLKAIEHSKKIPIKCVIVGGNQGGYDVEAVAKQIHTLRPDIDIAREKKGHS